MAHQHRPPGSLTASPHPLPLTGERTLPGVPRERYWFARHVAGYRRAAAALTRWRVSGVGRPALDAGCGEGYGARLLAEELPVGPDGREPRVVGVDYAPDVISHAAARYPRQSFAVAEVTALPFGAGAFGAIVASQIIEHLWDVDAWVGEIARVLAPGGALVVLTPNRLTFTPRGGPPTNPFHVTELDADELTAALSANLTVVEVDGIGHGERLAGLERGQGVSVPDAQASAPPEQWPEWLSDAVASTHRDDFGPASPATSLDLIATAVRR